LFELNRDGIMTSHFGDLSGIDGTHSAPSRPLYFNFIKRGGDVLFSLTALICLGPLMLLIAILIKLDSRGPVIFRQRRNGCGGRTFTIFKFRTMANQPDAVFKQCEAEDRRVTSIGRYLRKFNLDELPQLLNVLRGDMSIVGPRPHALEHDQQFVAYFPNYMKRYSVRPGLTGWAQVLGRSGPATTAESMTARLNADFEYIRRRSFALDTLIILRTLPAILSVWNAN
jgi:lipopolysaccharide/colanic/teichoic acid biosynthesis glycosyltransferase